MAPTYPLAVEEVLIPLGSELLLCQSGKYIVVKVVQLWGLIGSTAHGYCEHLGASNCDSDGGSSKPNLLTKQAKDNLFASRR